MEHKFVYGCAILILAGIITVIVLKAIQQKAEPAYS